MNCQLPASMQPFAVSQPKRVANRMVRMIDLQGRRFKVAVWPVTEPDTSVPNYTVTFGHVVTEPGGEYIGTVMGRRLGDWTYQDATDTIHARRLSTVLRVGLTNYINNHEGA